MSELKSFYCLGYSSIFTYKVLLFVNKHLYLNRLPLPFFACRNLKIIDCSNEPKLACYTQLTGSFLNHIGEVI